MKFVLKIGDMMSHLPGPVKDMIHSAAKEAGRKTDELDLLRKPSSQKGEVTPESRKKRQEISYISARSIDRDGEIVIPQGIMLKEYLKYGSVLCNHNYSLLPVGSAKAVECDDWGIKATTQFADTGEGTLANVVWHLVEQGHLKGKSIGFVPLSAVSPGERAWDGVATALQKRWSEFNRDAAEKSVSRIITKGFLLEYSVVTVPCNPDAEQIALVKGMGIKDRNVFKGLGWEANMEEQDGVLVPKVVKAIARPVREVIVVKSAGMAPVEKKETKEKGESKMKKCPKCGAEVAELKMDEKGNALPCAACLAKMKEEQAKQGKKEEGEKESKGLTGSPSAKALHGLSLSELTQALNEALNEAVRSRFSPPDNGNGAAAPSCVYVQDVFEDHVIFSHYGNGKERLLRLGYAVSGSGVELEEGEPEEVVRRVHYYPGKGGASTSAGNIEVVSKAFFHSPSSVSEKGMAETCKRKLRSLRARAGEDEETLTQVEALEDEASELGTDDEAGWTALNRKINPLLARVAASRSGKKEQLLKEEEKEQIEQAKKGKEPKPDRVVKVLSVPVSPERIVKEVVLKRKGKLD